MGSERGRCRVGIGRNFGGHAWVFTGLAHTGGVRGQGVETFNQQQTSGFNPEDRTHAVHRAVALWRARSSGRVRNERPCPSRST